MAPPTNGSGGSSYPTHLQHTLTSHTGPVNVIRYNHGARYLLSAGVDRSIRLWNPSTGKEIKSYLSGGGGHAREILGLDIAHDNAKFASCGADQAVFVWDVAAGNVIRKMIGHFGKIECVAFSGEGNVLGSAGFDAKVMLWDMRASSREPLQTLKDASSSITSLLIPSSLIDPSLPPTSFELITSSLDGHLRTYDLRMGRMTEDLVGSPVFCVAASKVSAGGSVASGSSSSTNTGTLLTSSADGMVRVWDRSNGGVLQSVDYRDTGMETGNVNGNGKAEGAGAGAAGKGQVNSRVRAEWGYGDETILVGGQDGRVGAWDVLSGRKIPSTSAYPEHRKAITWLEVAPNGKQMCTASADGTIKVWSTKPAAGERA